MVWFLRNWATCSWVEVYFRGTRERAVERKSREYASLILIIEKNVITNRFTQIITFLFYTYWFRTNKNSIRTNLLTLKIVHCSIIESNIIIVDNLGKISTAPNNSYSILVWTKAHILFISHTHQNASIEKGIK